MKKVLDAIIVLLIMLLNSGCTLDMLGYYDDASDGQAKSEKSKAFTSTSRKEAVVDEDIVMEDEIIEDEQKAITPQEVIKKELPKSPLVQEKEQAKEPEDKKKKTPEEIEKMKQEAKERVVNKLKEKDGEVFDENKDLSGWVEWRGNMDKSTLNLALENAKTGELYSESLDKNKKNAIVRLYYNGQFIQEDPIVSLNFNGENKQIYTITKDCSWVKDDDGWVLDICKVDFKNNKFEPLLYNETQ